MNIPLIFPFTCSSAKYDFFQSLPAAADLLDRANTAFLFRSFNQLLEKVGIAMIPNALYTFTKNASKTRIIPQCPTCLNQKMLDSEKGLIRNIQQECAVFTWAVSNSEYCHIQNNSGLLVCMCGSQCIHIIDDYLSKLSLC